MEKILTVAIEFLTVGYLKASAVFHPDRMGNIFNRKLVTTHEEEEGILIFIGHLFEFGFSPLDYGQQKTLHHEYNMIIV